MTVGVRVSVPFGSRVLTGMVLKVKASTEMPEEKVKAVKAISEKIFGILIESIYVSKIRL